MVSQLPEAEQYDKAMLSSFENIKETISGIRNIRKEKNIPNKEQIELKIQAGDKGNEPGLIPVLQKLGNLSQISLTETEIKSASSFRVKSTNYYIPLDEFIDVNEELKKLETELEYARGFLNSVMKKLNNQRFVNNAPEQVVAKEKAKKADAETKIKMLEERIASLK